jgi:antitoxin HigA-1
MLLHSVIVQKYYRRTVDHRQKSLEWIYKPRLIELFVMVSSELIFRLKQLSSSGKFYIIQMLIMELAQQETDLINPGQAYPISSPYDSIEAADTMSNILQTATTQKIDRLPMIHPGEILRLEFLDPLEITPYRLSKDIGVAQTRISEILAEKRSITADTALRLAKYFGNSPQFWLNLQTQYDLRQAQAESEEIYRHIPVAQLAHLA